MLHGRTSFREAGQPTHACLFCVPLHISNMQCSICSQLLPQQAAVMTVKRRILFFVCCIDLTALLAQLSQHGTQHFKQVSYICTTRVMQCQCCDSTQCFDAVVGIHAPPKKHSLVLFCVVCRTWKDLLPASFWTSFCFI